MTPHIRLTAVILVTTGVLFNFVGTGVIATIHNLEDILISEQLLAKKLGDLIQVQEVRLKTLKRLATEYRNVSSQDPETFLSNPLNGHRAVHTLSAGWYFLEQLVLNHPLKDFFFSMRSSLPTCPAYEDLQSCARALLTLQDTYDLTTSALASGFVASSKTRSMTGNDCFWLGATAHQDEDYYHSILWFTEALQRQRAEKLDNNTIGRTLGLLGFSYYKRGNTKAALELTKEWLQLELNDPLALKNKMGYEHLLRTHPLSAKQYFTNMRAVTGVQVAFERLCRGEVTKPNPYKHMLRCQYRRSHPFYLLRPLKEEVLYHAPFIALYHDIITDTEINTTKTLAKSQFESSTFEPAHSVGGTQSDHKVWLCDEEHVHLKHLSSKVSFASGMSLESEDPIQEPVFANDAVISNGQSIVTTVLHMSDVQAGGGTAFPNIGLYVKPEKGSMLLWYNLHHDGEGDMQILHGECPILLGSKWECYKRFHAGHQAFDRPCELDKQR